MQIKINDEMVELKFGFKFLNTLNALFNLDVQDIKVDAGIMSAYAVFKSLEPIGIFKIVKAAVAYLPKKVTDEKLFEALNDMLDDEYNGNLEQLAEALKTEMGKTSIIKASIDRLENTMEQQTGL